LCDICLRALRDEDLVGVTIFQVSKKIIRRAETRKGRERKRRESRAGKNMREEIKEK